MHSYANFRGMKLNPKKCKDMIIDFLQYKPSNPNPLRIGPMELEQVQSYKLLGVYVSNNLTWDVHCNYIVKKANKRLYAIRILKKCGLSTLDLIQVYCSIIRSILEYGAPVWSGLPQFLSDLIESVQRRVLRIIYPGLSYEQALVESKLPTLKSRREELCIKFMCKS